MHTPATVSAPRFDFHTADNAHPPFVGVYLVFDGKRSLDVASFPILASVVDAEDAALEYIKQRGSGPYD